MTKSWRHHLPKETNDAINRIVRRVTPYKTAFTKNRKVRTNQLWVAMGEMHRDMERLQRRLTDTEQELTRLKGALRRTGEELVKQ